MAKVQLHNGSEYIELTEKMVLRFIEDISACIGLTGLDLGVVVSNVYPKMKHQNEQVDLEDMVILATTEMIIDHYDYQKIAVKILVDRLNNQTHDDYLKVLEQLENNVSKNGKIAPIVSPEYSRYVRDNIDAIMNALDYSLDYDLSIFGYRTLERAYLKRSTDNEIIERPQHAYMRVAIGIHFQKGTIDRVIQTYQHISQGYMIHATPTMFNSGTQCAQLSSCFLLSLEDDMESIGDCWKNCAIISKYSGGLSVNVSNLRGSGSYIASTQGVSNGLHVLKVFNEVANYANQGGKRPGSIAIYLEPWHPDIMFFLEVKKNTGAESERTRDLFTGLMINDLFMERVKQDKMWSLMCPNICPDIVGQYGEQFNKAYLRYESQGLFVKQLSARDVWFKIMEAQIETGSPYILFKDSINYKSNQINIGVVNSSNLCTEIVQVSTPDEYAVCNLASICLPKMIDGDRYDYQKLYEVTRILTRNLNTIIDVNFYPVEQTRRSNMKHRPIAIGVQGLADVFAMFKTPFDSELARDLNKKIFETIYFGAMTESNAIAKEQGHYETFIGSPLSQGVFQYQMWGLNDSDLSGMWDWGSLREEILKHGVANSLTTSCMPTASTSQIMYNNETIEPYDNLYTRATNSGNFYVVNKHMVKDLLELDLWDKQMIDTVKYFDGSIDQIPSIPDDIKQIYRTVWEIPQKSIIEMAADRAVFLDQTQSMNLYIDKPDFRKLNSCLFYGWSKGLKTGMYYLRSKAASSANKFGISIDLINKLKEGNAPVCKYVPKHLRTGDDCLMCSG